MTTDPTPADIITSICSTFSGYNVLDDSSRKVLDAEALEHTRQSLRKQCDSITDLLSRTRSPFMTKDSSEEQTGLSKLSITQAVVLEHFLTGACSLQCKDSIGTSLCCLNATTAKRRQHTTLLSPAQVSRDAELCCEKFTASVNAHFASKQAMGKSLDKRYVSNHRRKVLHHIINNRLPLLLTHVLSELRGRMLDITHPSPPNNVGSRFTQASALFVPNGANRSHCICNVQEISVWITHNGVMAIDACDAMEDVISSSFSKCGSATEALLIMKPYFAEVIQMLEKKSLRTPSSQSDAPGLHAGSTSGKYSYHQEPSTSQAPATHQRSLKYWDKFRSRCIPGRANVLTFAAMSLVYDHLNFANLTPLALRTKTFRSFLDPLQEVVQLLKGMASSLVKLNEVDTAHNSISSNNVFLAKTEEISSDQGHTSHSSHPISIRFGSLRHLRRFGTRLSSPTGTIALDELDIFEDEENSIELPLHSPHSMPPEISDFILNSSPESTFSFQNSSADVFGFGVILEALLSSIFGFNISRTYDPVHPTTPVGQKLRRRPDFLSDQYQPFEDTKESLLNLVAQYFHNLEYSRKCALSDRDLFSSSSSPPSNYSAINGRVYQVANSGRHISRKRLLGHARVRIGSGTVDLNLDHSEFEELGRSNVYSIASGFRILHDSERIILHSLAKSAKADEATISSYLHYDEDSSALQRFIDPVAFAVVLGSAKDVPFNYSSFTVIQNTLKNVVDCSTLSRKLGSKLLRLAVQCCQERPSRRPTPNLIIQSLNEVQSDLDFMCK